MKVSMNARLFRQLIAGTLLIGGLAVAAQAEEPTTVNKIVTPAAASVTGETFTLQSLGSTLDVMGYEVTPEGGDNITAYNVKFSESNISGSVRVSVSTDQTVLWTSVFVMVLEPGQATPADLALRMLDANAECGPCYFYSTPYEGKRYIYMACPVANRNITKPQLRKTISNLVQMASKTEHLWNAAKWEKTTALAKE